jgi:hypothetical protein
MHSDGAVGNDKRGNGGFLTISPLLLYITLSFRKGNFIIRLLELRVKSAAKYPPTQSHMRSKLECGQLVWKKKRLRREMRVFTVIIFSPYTPVRITRCQSICCCTVRSTVLALASRILEGRLHLKDKSITFMGGKLSRCEDYKGERYIHPTFSSIYTILLYTASLTPLSSTLHLLSLYPPHQTTPHHKQNRLKRANVKSSTALSP